MAIQAGLQEGRTVVAALCAAQFMLILNVVVIYIALPSISRSLSIADSQVHLVGVFYTVTFGSLLIVFGRAGDLLGRRRVLLVGLGVFVAAALGAGAAQAGWQLFAARAAQGIGAAMVSANALAAINDRFEEGSRRNKALGWWAMVGSAGAIAGQLVGGLITQFVGWRWVFLVNVPVGVVVMALLAATLRESTAERAKRLDIAGSVLLAGTLACLVVGLVQSAQDDSRGLAVALLVASGVLALVFAQHERRAAEPMLQVDLLRLPGVQAGNLTLFLNAGALGATLFFIALYLQNVLGYSALAVSAVFAPVTLIILILSPRAAALTGRVGVRAVLSTGLGLLACGVAVLARLPLDGGLVDVVPGMLLLAVGSSLAYAPTFIAASSGVPAGDQGAASGLINSMQEIGAAACLALLAFLASWVPTGGTPVENLTNGYRAGLLGAAVLLVGATVIALRTPALLGRVSAAQPTNPASVSA